MENANRTKIWNMVDWRNLRCAVISRALINTEKTFTDLSVRCPPVDGRMRLAPQLTHGQKGVQVCAVGNRSDMVSNSYVAASELVMKSHTQYFCYFTKLEFLFSFSFCAQSKFREIIEFRRDRNVILTMTPAARTHDEISK